MPRLVPGIHDLLSSAAKTWMAGTSPAMTTVRVWRYATSSIFTLSG
jgi:hypothetical protein